MEYEQGKHNTPISTVIKRFLDKKGGKVRSSRKEIVWRFNALDWRYQKQILFAFLESGKSDRDWAYRKLFVYWDDCFIPVLKRLWEEYNEFVLSRLIIKYFPIEFIKENCDKLSDGHNYYYICYRMYDVEGFVIDKTRLNECDLLRIMHVLGEPVTLGDAKDMFFMLIYKFCKGVYDFRAWRTVEIHDNTPTLYILDRPIIRNMLLEIEFVESNGLDLSVQLREWIRTVTIKFLCKYQGESDMFWHKEEEPFARCIQKAFCYGQIDTEYTRVWDTFDCNNQQQFLDYLEKRHKEYVNKEDALAAALKYIEERSSVRKLIDDFDLEVVES